MAGRFLMAEGSGGQVWGQVWMDCVKVAFNNREMT